MRSAKMLFFPGGKHLIPAIGLGMLLLAAPPAGNEARAQDEDTESELLACDTIEDEAERIQCINDLVQRLRTQGGTVEPGAPDNSSPSAQPGTTALPEVNTPERETRSSPADADPSDTFGFPERSRDSEKERLIVEIERWETNPIGKTVFWLKNGQVWIENKSSDFRMSSDHGIAEIYISWMGGYRMEIDGVPGFARVRRIR